MGDDHGRIIPRRIDPRANGRAAKIDLAQEIGKFPQTVDVSPTVTAKARNSEPSRIGTASMNCVRPTLMI